MSFCNTTGVSLTCIVQAKWLNSCGIVSQLSVTNAGFQAPWDLGKQPVTYPPCAALTLAAAAGAQVPYARMQIETKNALQAYSCTEKLLPKLSRIDIAPY